MQQRETYSQKGQVNAARRPRAPCRGSCWVDATPATQAYVGLWPSLSRSREKGEHAHFSGRRVERGGKRGPRYALLSLPAERRER